MEKILPIIAIVGQPNAGKSTLMNKIAGKPLAVTSELAGTTRDRQYVDSSFSGVEFTLVDTAGLDLGKHPELELSLQKQIDVALGQADAVIFVVDGKEPVTAVSSATLKKFRSAKKPLLLAVNKIDSPKLRTEKLIEFQRLGIKPAFTVSAITGAGLGDLLESLVSQLEKLGLAGLHAQKTVGICVSLVGKPNVGKSSLFNEILQEERVVVSPIPGTTRTAIDSHIKINDADYTFIDTAGLKKKEHRQAEPDLFSGFQTFKSIRRSDVCLFVLDANSEITKQDQIIAGEILDMQKGCIILANKIDLVAGAKAGGKGTGSKSKSDDSYNSLRDYISHHFPFLWMCPLFFVSAVNEEGLDEALDAIKPIYERRNTLLDNQELTEFLHQVLKKNPPKLLRDQKKPKVFSLRQLDVNPPKFELLVNHPAAISQQFRKFLENSIIKHLDFYGTPIVLRLKGKDKS